MHRERSDARARDIVALLGVLALFALLVVACTGFLGLSLLFSEPWRSIVVAAQIVVFFWAGGALAFWVQVDPPIRPRSARLPHAD